jgi:hypothetical protein
MSGGQFTDSVTTISQTFPPYTLQWDGTAVVEFDHAGSNARK